MKAMIEAAARIKEIQNTTTISRMIELWNTACCVSCRTDYCIAEGAGAKRKAAVIALMDDLLSRLTPETEQIAATLVTEGDVIYNAATGEQYQVMKATISDPNTAILANRGPQVFFDHDELVTVIKRDRRVHTRSDMTMSQLPAERICVGSWVYVCGAYRLVTKVTTLTNNVRYEGEGFSVILGKSVMVDVGTEPRTARDTALDAIRAAFSNTTIAAMLTAWENACNIDYRADLSLAGMEFKEKAVLLGWMESRVVDRVEGKPAHTFATTADKIQVGQYVEQRNGKFLRVGRIDRSEDGVKLYFGGLTDSCLNWVGKTVGM